MVVSTNKMVKIICFFKINKTSPINKNKIKINDEIYKDDRYNFEINMTMRSTFHQP